MSIFYYIQTPRFQPFVDYLYLLHYVLALVSTILIFQIFLALTRLTVFPDEEGVVRTVNVKLRPRDKRDSNMPYKYKTSVIMEVGVQRLVLIVANEDITVAADEET